MLTRKMLHNIYIMDTGVGGEHKQKVDLQQYVACANKSVFVNLAISADFGTTSLLLIV